MIATREDSKAQVLVVGKPDSSRECDEHRQSNDNTKLS